MGSPAEKSAEQPRTALATREQIAAAVKAAPAGELPPAVRAAIEERKLINRMATAIAGATWNKAGFTGESATAVAEWCRRHDVDPVAELDVLGNRLYKKADWYIRKGAELKALGMVRDVEVDHIAADPRLDEAAKSDDAETAAWAKQERARRLRLRIQHGAPEKAAAVVVFRIYLPTAATPVEGVNWCGGGVKRNDPVGDAEPTKTAETRAARRAWRHLVTQLPTISTQEGDAEEEGVALERVIGEARTLTRATDAEHQRALPARGRAMTWQTAPGGDVYATAEAETVGARDAGAIVGGAAVGGGEDPYDDRHEGGDADAGGELALDDPRPARRNAIAEGA